MRLALSLVLILSLTGCVSRRLVDSHLWMNNGMSEELCQKYPEIQDYGFYRKISKGPKKGKMEFVSYCSPFAKRWVSMYDEDLEEFLNSTIGGE